MENLNRWKSSKVVEEECRIRSYTL